jgi:hypothetical protein
MTATGKAEQPFEDGQTKSHHFLSLKCNASRGLAMEWALTSSVKVTSMNASDTNESAAALRLTGELNLRMKVS